MSERKATNPYAKFGSYRDQSKTKEDRPSREDPSLKRREEAKERFAYEKLKRELDNKITTNKMKGEVDLRVEAIANDMKLKLKIKDKKRADDQW